MRRYILWVAALLVLILPVAAKAQDYPPGNIYSSAPFSSNPKHFTAANCGVQLSCTAGESDVLKAANTCAQTRLGFPAGLLGKYVRDGGAYKNCAIPTTYAKTGPGLGAKAQWPICCLTPGDGGNCNMVCHFYMTNE